MHPLVDETLTFPALETLTLRRFEALLLMFRGVGFGIFLIDLGLFVWLRGFLLFWFCWGFFSHSFSL